MHFRSMQRGGLCVGLHIDRRDSAWKSEYLAVELQA